MIHVSLAIVVHPQRAAEMTQALRSLMLPLQGEPGFISCRLYSQVDDHEALCYVEEWQTAQDLDHQIRSIHYTRLLALMEEAVLPPDLRISWVTDVKGIEYLEAVRLGELGTASVPPPRGLG